MANFQTHLGGAALGSGLVLSGVAITGLLTPQEAVAGWCLAMIGGILPDIDSSHSKPIRALFFVLAGMAAIACILALQQYMPQLPLAGLWLAAIASFFVMRYGGWYLFARFTVHRGLYHSLLAVAFFGGLTTTLSYQLLTLSAEISWTMGLCVSLGYLIHLVLDECYSVDLTGIRVKRSFGTALKLFDYKRPFNSLLMLTLLVVMLTQLAPPLDELWYLLSSLKERWSWQVLIG